VLQPGVKLLPVPFVCAQSEGEGRNERWAQALEKQVRETYWERMGAASCRIRFCDTRSCRTNRARSTLIHAGGKGHDPLFTIYDIAWELCLVRSSPNRPTYMTVTLHPSGSVLCAACLVIDYRERGDVAL
jgi:hypothetical protein